MFVLSGRPVFKYLPRGKTTHNKMNDVESQESQILKQYPVAARRLAQYLIERRDFENFRFVYHKYNLDFNKLHLKLPYFEIDEKTTDFMKKLYHDGIYVPDDLNIFLHFGRSRYELFEFYITQGVMKKTKRAELLDQMTTYVNALQANGKGYQCPKQMEQYFEFVRNTPMLQD